MNGDSSDEYKKSLAESTTDNVDPLVTYLKKQDDFIKLNKDMF